MGEQEEVSHQLRTSDDHAAGLGCRMGAATLAARQRASGLDRCAYSGGLAPEVRDRLFVLTSGLKRGAKVGALVLGDAVRNVPGRERRRRGCSEYINWKHLEIGIHFPKDYPSYREQIERQWDYGYQTILNTFSL